MTDPDVQKEASNAFNKYGLVVPLILSLFLEILKITGNFPYTWFWVLSPVWVWFGGIFQLFLAGIIYELTKEVK